MRARASRAAAAWSCCSTTTASCSSRENPSRALHKISEIYDRIAFAAVGRYNEFENLRIGRRPLRRLRGYTYDRDDVTGRGLANVYAQTLGTSSPSSREAIRGGDRRRRGGRRPAEDDQIYRLTYDGSVVDEHGYVAMGGQAEAIATVLKEHYSEGMSLSGALAAAIAGLAAQANGDRMDTSAGQLEVAVLERTRDHRTFRRLTGARLESLLAEAGAAGGTGQAAAGQAAAGEQAPGEQAAGEAPGTAGPSASGAGSAPGNGQAPMAEQAGTDGKTAGTDRKTGGTDSKTGGPKSPQSGQADSPEPGQSEPGGESVQRSARPH